MAFKVKIIAPQLPKNLRRRVPERIMHREMKRAANEGAEVGTRVMARVSPLAVGTLRQSWLAGIRPARIFGRTAVAVVSSGGIVALVWDDGTNNHPFPPVPASGTPALGVWIRRKLGSSAFVQEDDGTRRSADLNNERDMKKIAFKIGAAIRSRGLPNPSNPRARAKGLYTRAWRAVRPELERFQRRMVQRLVDLYGE